MPDYKSAGDASYSALFNKCKHAAKQRGLLFDLTRNQHKELTQLQCHYCGNEPISFNSYLKNAGKDEVRVGRYRIETISRNWIRANGIDRKDNGTGYVFDNCLPCCATCNYLKCDMSYNDFVVWIRKAYNHINGQSK